MGLWAGLALIGADASLDEGGTELPRVCPENPEGS